MPGASQSEVGRVYALVSVVVPGLDNNQLVVGRLVHESLGVVDQLVDALDHLAVDLGPVGVVLSDATDLEELTALLVVSVAALMPGALARSP